MTSFILTHQVGLFLFLIVGSIFTSILLLIVVLLWKKATRLERRLATFCAGKDGAHLEETLMEMHDHIAVLDGEIQELFSISNKIHARANRGLHKVAMMRFNPFKDLGGNQSFSLALLDGKNNGVIISSLHTREGTRVYSKTIVAGAAPDYELTEEEKTVLTQAQNKKVLVGPTKTN